MVVICATIFGFEAASYIDRVTLQSEAHLRRGSQREGHEAEEQLGWVCI
jgi:hypothetical protein